MIDFPNAPADQQIFNGPNGVVYRWIAATSLWQALGVGQQSITVGDTAPANPFNGMMWWNSTLAQLFIYYNDGNSSQWVPAVPPATQLMTTPGGDFFAYNNATFTLPTAATQFSPNTIYSGNSGGWYNPSNGRFTPPPGRYLLMAGFVGSWSGGATGMWIYLRKNGVNLGGGTSSFVGAESHTTAAANYVNSPMGTAVVDANGTDYFDFTILSGSGGTGSSCFFMAFPLSGVQGPPGPGNAWRILSRQTPSAAGFVEVQAIPADINEIEVHFDLLPVPATSDLTCQFYGATGVLDTTTGHYAFSVFGSQNAAAANAAATAMGNGAVGYSAGILLDYSATGGYIVNTAGTGIKGSFKVVNIKGATRKALLGSSAYINNSGNLSVQTTIGDRNILEAITGLRLTFTAGNIASGSFEVWGSP